MAHLLYHWRFDNYLRDLEMGVGFHLNQKSPVLHEIEPGESLWAFTRLPQKDGTSIYVLAAQLVCHAKTRNPELFRYGTYRVYGDLQVSRYLNVYDQMDVTPLVKSFPIATGQKETPLGQAFQGNAAVRVIGEDQHQLLLEWARDIAHEPKARLLPEDILERQDDFVLSKPMALMSENRRKYLLTQSRTRRASLVSALRDLYDGRCQISGWNPRSDFGRDLCEAHHVQWLSRGGEDEMSNLILISPNIHRLIHAVDASFDYQEMSFKTEHPLKIQIISESHILTPHE